MLIRPPRAETST